MNGFAYNMIENKFDNSIQVKYHLPNSNRTAAFNASTVSKVTNTLTDCKVVSFLFNGKPIIHPNEQMAILSLIISFVVHPMEHSFFPVVYEHRNDPALAAYPELFYHGQYLNEIASDYPADCYRMSRDWIRALLAHNAKIDLPFHGADICKIQPFSRFVRFLLPARLVLLKQMKKHKINMNGEALYITSIVHSIDHLFIGDSLEDHHLDTS